MRGLLWILLGGALLAGAGCFHDNDDADSTSEGGMEQPPEPTEPPPEEPPEEPTEPPPEEPPSEPAGTLMLDAADRPQQPPCPDQAILTDPAQLTNLKAALEAGTLVFLDVPYDGGDPDIFKKKCGLEGFWDPTQNSREVGLANIGLDPATTPNIADLLLFGNAGICAADFTPASFGTGEGFPVAGTYRHEIKAAHMGMTYHLRFRTHVEGTAAGDTFTEQSITVPDDVRNTLIYTVNGVQTTHAGIFDALVDGMSASPDDAPSAVIQVQKTAQGPVIFTANVQLICTASM